MIRLSVPFTEKDEVKKYGARWNPNGKFWYYPGGELPAELRKWALKGTQADAAAKPLETPAVSKTNGLSAAEAGLFTAAEAGLFSTQETSPEPFLTVSQLSELIRTHYYREPAFRSLLVRGEVTNLNEKIRQDGSAHLYFSLKDPDALIGCILWKDEVKSALAAPLKNGQMVSVKGSLDYFTGQGRTQLKAERITELGVGNASLALLQLHKKLEQEGLFSPEWKKPIPKHPQAVGIVTSRSGQAIQDICKVAAKRDPYVQLVLYPVTVQGKQAAESIVKGIQALDAYGVDTIIVGRGGGSEEELYSYNDEAVVRAVFAAKTPVISAVGHAGNWTLIDFVSDKRVATPTEAAEEAVPDVMAEMRRLKTLTRELQAVFLGQLLQKKKRLEVQRTALEARHPRRLLEERKTLYAYLKEKMDAAVQAVLQRDKNRFELQEAALRAGIGAVFDRKKHRFELTVARLHGLSPTAKLVKGFGYISLAGAPLVSVEQAQPGDTVEIRIHDGALEAGVTHIRRENDA
ncbi:MAG: exodeoxyribonuclease VII large subunit [Lachnospiraceae bacterium]|nr:exodeoxyribonuclease VII large subunit [Lachnospiraceae bacterium]